MGDDESLRAAKTFIDTSIDSVVQLEILLLLYREPEREWSTLEVAQRLRVDRAWIVDELAHLCARCLLIHRPGDVPVYRFAAGNPDLRREVQNLAQIYADRRVTIVTLIASKPVDKIRVFTDAFKLRQEGEDG